MFTKDNKKDEESLKFMKPFTDSTFSNISQSENFETNSSAIAIGDFFNSFAREKATGVA